MRMPGNILIWALVIFSIISRNNNNVIAESAVAVAVAGSPGAGSECMTLIFNMSDCLSYVEKGSNVTQPDKQCCPELASVLDNNPICLCQLLGKSKDFAVELDVSKALHLPSVCGFHAPPLSFCSAAGIPIGGPAGAPSSSQGPSSSSGGKSADEAGETSPGKNEASNKIADFRLSSIVAVLAIAFI